MVHGYPNTFPGLPAEGADAVSGTWEVPREAGVIVSLKPSAQRLAGGFGLVFVFTVHPSIHPAVHSSSTHYPSICPLYVCVQARDELVPETERKPRGCALYPY